MGPRNLGRRLRPDVHFGHIPRVRVQCEQRNTNFRPREHFEEIVHVWETDFNDQLFTVRPEAVNEHVYDYLQTSDTTRSVVHYLQPHEPYIGETPIETWKPKRDERELDDIEGAVAPKTRTEHSKSLPHYHVPDQIANGEPTVDELRQAYKENFRLVLEQVTDLIKYLDCTVLLTADHGEHLGEDGRFGHPNITHPTLRELPWFVVDDSMVGTADVSSLTEDQTAPAESDSTDVERHMQQFGYL
ncbi:alkaline phosphatase family protein [Haloarcula halophila]|uniref:hypothetical protein n=1 Tax=Haloarcula TaxID=2237 RepID=UPI0023E4114D|nr:hypothetical protein [Halomicroarcula sp. DFY41]